MNFFRNIFHKMSLALSRFMMGRYGSDKLNIALLIAGMVIGFLGALSPWLKVVFMIISYALMVWAIYRMLSRQTYKRYQENRKFLQFFERLRDRQHRYYDCPRCRQQVRVPRGKGKISITCPKCKEKFIKKT